MYRDGTNLEITAVKWHTSICCHKMAAFLPITRNFCCVVCVVLVLTTSRKKNLHITFNLILNSIFKPHCTTKDKAFLVDFSYFNIACSCNVIFTA